MPPPRRIPPAEWEGHKDRIVELYLDQGLTLYGRPGRDGVIETMEKEGFVATKSQYEAKLREWNVRKNMTLGEWKRHAPDIQESRQRGETPPIRVSGRPIPNARVAKAWRRYGLGGNQAARRVTRDNDHTAPRSEIPSISTEVGQSPVEEAAPEAEDLLPLESTDETLGISVSGGLDGFDLNSIDFSLNNAGANTLTYSTSQGQDGAIDMNMLSSNSLNLDEILSLDMTTGGAIGTAEINHSANIVIPPITYASSLTLPSNLVGATLRPSVVFPRELWIGSLPSAKVISMAIEGISGMVFAASTHSSLSGVARFQLVAQFFSDVQEFFSPEDAMKYAPISFFPNVLTCLASDETFVGEENQFAMLSSDDAFESRFCSRLIRSLMNGFAGLEGMPIEGVLKFLKSQYHTQSLLVQFLRFGPKCEAKSLAESTFGAALEADDPEVVKLLLQHGLVDANNTICLIEWNRYTPLEAAAELQSLKVVKLLLDLKVDVNKSAQLSRPEDDYDFECSCPLDLLISYHPREGTLEQSFLQLVNDLSARATIREELMKYLFRDPVDTRLASILLDAFVSQSPLKVIRADLLVHIVKYFDEDDTIYRVKLVIEMHQRSDNQRYFHQFHEELSSALDEAIAHGYLELVGLLLPHCTSLDKPFRTAIEKGTQEVVDIIIEKNPNLDDEIDGSTPLAAALETGNQDLLLLLEKRGVLDRLQGGCHPELGIAIAAALKAGNKGYATKLLDLELDVDGDQLIVALNTALIYDYDDIAWRLLAAGANTTWNEGMDGPIYERAIPGVAPFPLYFATKKRKLEMVRAMLECNLYTSTFARLVDTEERQSLIVAVVKWGDRSILNDILQMYFVGPSSEVDLMRILEDVDRDILWTIIKLSPRERQETLSAALKVAVKQQDTSLLRELFDFGAPPDDEDALLEAVMRHPSMVEPLLKRFREFYPRGSNNYGIRTLETAICRYQTYSDSLDVLLAFELVDTNILFSQFVRERSHMPRWKKKDEAWTRSQDLDIFKKLLNAGCDPNLNFLKTSPLRVNYHGFNSPLLAAINTRSIEIVRLVVERGARVNEPTRPFLKWTPLQKAAEEGSLEIVRFLLEKGADVNAAAAGRYGGTALQFAAIVGDCTMATELIEHGAKLDTRPSWGPEGRWPLEGAAENGRIDMIQLLWYASPSAFDDKICRKAMKLAERYGHFGCRDKIVELMSTPRPAAAQLPVSWEGLSDDLWGEEGFSMLG